MTKEIDTSSEAYFNQCLVPPPLNRRKKNARIKVPYVAADKPVITSYEVLRHVSIYRQL